MRFHEATIAAFLSNFEEVKYHIRNFEGNLFLELYHKFLHFHKFDLNLPEYMANHRTFHNFQIHLEYR